MGTKTTVHGSDNGLTMVVEENMGPEVTGDEMEVFFTARTRPPENAAEHAAKACMDVMTLAARRANEIGQKPDGKKLLALMDALEAFYT